MAAAAAGFPAWAATPVEERAAVLERAADRLEVNRGRLIALLQSEGGKTLDDALAELREAVDYCRYYAAQARIALAPQPMPGPTGESNELRYRGRGVFVCISPWNFPLAIFLGQVTAALVAGNTVVAKPAEQTPLIAALAVALLHEAGVPASALHLVPGDGAVGASLVADPRVAGVAFTGSTEVGRAINRALADKDGADRAADRRDRRHQRHDRRCHRAARAGDRRRGHVGVPLRRPALLGAAAAVPAGRRRRAHARHADRRGARAEGRRPARHRDPCRPGDRCRGQSTSSTAGSPRRSAPAALRFRWDRDAALPAAGTYVGPAIIELDRARDLKEEVFGPVLHVVRWRADELDALLDDIAGNGTALTLGIHSRIDCTVDRIAARLASGNVYVNRNMIGAVVGTQPFGGTRLSGTGPKAGGPNYLRRFASEQVVTVNTAAAGGNASLLAQGE